MLLMVLRYEDPDNDRRHRQFTLTAGRRLWEQAREEACRSAVQLAWRQVEGVASAEEVQGQLDALRPVYEEAVAVDSWEVARMTNVLAPDQPCFRGLGADQADLPGGRR